MVRVDHDDAYKSTRIPFGVAFLACFSRVILLLLIAAVVHFTAMATNIYQTDGAW